MTNKQTVKTISVTDSRPSLCDHSLSRLDCIFQNFPRVKRELPIPKKFLHDVEHILQTIGPPLFARPRQLPPDRLAIVRREFDFVLKQGICRPSVSSWASPLLLIAKKDGSFRPCGDYRQHNNVTVPERYPLTYLQDFAANLAGKTVFSKLDLVHV